MVKKLDARDYKILYQLSKNSRISVSQLAKTIGLSRDVTNYKINKLRKRGVIKDYITEIDETKLGYSRHCIYLIFQALDGAKEKEIIDFIVAHPFVAWTTVCIGEWNIGFDFLSKDIAGIYSFVEELKEKYGQFIGEHLIVSYVSFAHFNSKYYHHLVEKEVKKKKRKTVDHTLDSIDLKLLRLLSNNARLDYMTLSKKLGLSANAVKNRIHVLLDAQIIKGFTINPNHKLLGHEQRYILLNFVGNQTREQTQEMISYVKEHPHLDAYYTTLGHWSFEIAMFSHDPAEAREIILDLKNKFGHSIKILNTILFYDEPKANYLPEGVFKG